jgi:hypothetical protein
VIEVRFALPAVGRVQPGGQCQGVGGPAAIGCGEPGDLHQQALAQAHLAVHGSDRVQWHRGEQALFGRAQARVGPGHQSHGFLGHGRLRPSRQLRTVRGLHRYVTKV